MIAVFFIGKDIYQNAQIKTSLSVMVIDSTGSAQEAAAKKLEEDLGISDDPYHRVSLDESVRMDRARKNWILTVRCPLLPRLRPKAWIF